MTRRSLIRLNRTRLILALGAMLASGPKIGTAANPSRQVRYNRDIRPILSENCFFCHGPDKKQRKAELRLDVREDAVSRDAIVPGKPDKSEVIKRIYTADEDDLMPPPETHKNLTSAQKETLKQWIAGGAEYEPHWAYITPQRPDVPPVKNQRWVRNPVDAFILRTLESRGLKPSREADGRTLLRRLSLDLIALPPTPEEVQAFLADKDPHAYERQVERLLASPHFGERIAVPWLDVVRFADTVGYHGDQNQNVFPYRDYVIDSFNRNMPFDQFTIEQIAGDLVPNPTQEQLIATGFNRLNMLTREGGAQPKEYLAKYAADRVRTVSTTWLGSTMACAECHDHKYDPFTLKDFYQMAAFFGDIQQWGVYNDYKYTPNPDLKGWSNDHPFPPEMDAESPYLLRRKERFERAIHDLFAASAVTIEAEIARRGAFAGWMESSRRFLTEHPDGWHTPRPEVFLVKDNKSSMHTNVVVAENGFVQFERRPEKGEAYQLVLRREAGRVAAIRLEAMPAEGAEAALDAGAQRQGLRLSLALRPRDGMEQKLTVYHAEADHKEPRYANGAELIGVKAGWKLSRRHIGQKQTSVWLLDPPVVFDEHDALVVTFGGDAIAPVRISVSPLASERPLESGGHGLFKSLLTTPENRTDSQRILLAGTYLLSTAWDAEAFGDFKRLYREMLECRDGRSPTLITKAWEPRVTRVLARGNWQDDSGDVVEPAPPHFLLQRLELAGRQAGGPAGQQEDDAKRRLTRLDLAKWLVRPENPLTARTFVNRLWKQFFGAGISAVVDDLGAQGEWPTHPELLDWLAVEFMAPKVPVTSLQGYKVTSARSGAVASCNHVTAQPCNLCSPHAWDIKHIIRLIVTSATYRQESNPSSKALALDPQNRLLSAQSPRRLDAEFVRDNALCISGLLNLEMGGPSARPYQPADYYVNLQFPDRDYVAHMDERQYRRGVYMHWQRTFLHPMLANFDAPSREECTANRILSNTPQQALTLLNDPSFVEASRVFAAKLLTSDALSDERRLELVFQQALARTVKPNEKKSLEQFVARQRVHYKENPDDARKLLHVGFAPVPPNIDESELAAWTQVCRVVLNLHETMTRY